MDLGKIVRTIMMGPDPAPDSMGNYMADRMNENNPYASYFRTLRGGPSLALINQAANWDMQNRGMNLNEAEFDARTFTPTNQMAGTITPDNSYGWMVQPGQRRYIDNINQAVSNQDKLNQQRRFLGAADSFLNTMRGMEGFNPNDPNMAILNNPGFFGQENMPNAALGALGNIQLGRAAAAKKQALASTYVGFVNSLPQGTLRAMLSSPEMMDFYTSNEDELTKLINAHIPQPEKPLTGLDMAKIEQLEADAMLKRHLAGKPYYDPNKRYGMAGSKEEYAKSFLGQVDKVYKNYVDQFKINNRKMTATEFALAKNQGMKEYRDYNDYLNNQPKMLSKDGFVRSYLSPEDQAIYYESAPKATKPQGTTQRYKQLPGSVRQGQRFSLDDSAKVDKYVVEHGGVARAMQALWEQIPENEMMALLARYNQNNKRNYTLRQFMEKFINK